MRLRVSHSVKFAIARITKATEVGQLDFSDENFDRNLALKERENSIFRSLWNFLPFRLIFADFGEFSNAGMSLGLKGGFIADVASV